MPAIGDPPALELIGVGKSFGSVAACRDISLTLSRGEIHGVIGENGAGKSTLMSILFGLVRADAGSIQIDGRPATIQTPRDAMALGIGMVHQHFMLVETMSVLDNLVLGRESGAFMRKSRAAMREKLAGLARAHGLAIDPDACVADLPVGLRQRVEILKALTRGARVLALDEPTAALAPEEAKALFSLMRSLAAAGATIIFITHKLGEALEITDRISVLRAGELVSTFDTARVDATTLAEAMVGRPVNSTIAKKAGEPGAFLLEARELRFVDDRGHIGLDRISLGVRSGEILGIAGVAGNGQSELLEILAGMRRASGGALMLAGEVIDLHRFDPARARARGIAHIPEDRLRHGVVGNFSASENVLLGRWRERRFGQRLLNPGAIRDYCAGLMRRWDVRPSQPSMNMTKFSGGNQQKLVFAREVENDPRILLIGQPTRGVDIGAMEAIHRRIVELRDCGKAIVLVSSDLDEILGLSDRVIVMHAGRIAGECAANPSNRRDIGLMMAGALERAA